ncbi:hypothetical protein BK022_02740 [Methylorubrum extorquens]|uniref:Uncharacterized protein n=1 Tax=Methylorubrum extorquens TaxID=408 RepID=A0A1S1P4I5_METEX|nr:hypothetical protein BK022_02740 [Methylorubrum extorquens]
MTTTAESFDARRFEHLYRLATSIPTGGYDNKEERDNARGFAGRMAAKAGLTFEQAVALIEIRAGTPSNETRAQAEKTARWKAHCEEHERRQSEERAQAEQARRDRQREHEAREAKARREAERREAEAAVWRRSSPESEVETAVARAARRLGLNPYGAIRRVTPDIESAARYGHPFPESFAEAIAEFEALESAGEKRRRPVPKYRHGGLIALRNELIVRFLSGRSPTPEDAAARAEWVKSRGTDLPGPSLDVWFGIIADDVTRILKSLDAAKAKMAAGREHREYRAARPAKPLKMTTAQKRKAVNDILDGPGADKLTLREVAERAGVHHSTVAEIRRERQGHA